MSHFYVLSKSKRRIFKRNPDYGSDSLLILLTTVKNGQKCAWLSFLWHPKVKWVLDTSLESLLSVVFGTSGITFQKRSGKFLFDLEARYPQYGK